MRRGPVLIRCDASARVGFGHAARCLALADALSRAGAGVVFAMGEDEEGMARVGAAGHRVTERGSDEGEEWLAEVARANSVRALVLDVRDPMSRDAVEGIRRCGVAIAVIDDGSERRLAADLAFYPPVPQVATMDWRGFRGQLHAGFEWVILRPAFSDPVPRPASPRPTVLVTMGASDTRGLTAKTIEALDLVGPGAGEFDTIVVVGPWCEDPGLERAIAACRRPIEVLRDVRDMAHVLARADLAVAAFGTTAYELAALGVPALLLCASEDDLLSASALVHAGAALSLSCARDAPQPGIAAAVEDLLVDPRLREQLSAAGRRLLDARGAERIARAILAFLRRRGGA